MEASALHPLRIPTKADTCSDRRRTVFRLIADSIPMIPDRHAAGHLEARHTPAIANTAWDRLSSSGKCAPGLCVFENLIIFRVCGGQTVIPAYAAKREGRRA